MASGHARIPPLPALRDFIHMYKLRAKKILSQNYLMDMNLNRKIVRAAGITADDCVCEVGPGPGGITRAILATGCRRLDVVEIDHRFIPPLQHVSESVAGRMHIHQSDILRFDIGDVWSKSEDVPSSKSWHEGVPNFHVVGNLPFNIASPLIIRYLKQMSYRQGPWQFGRVPLTLTFQLEVAQRICSPLACDTRSRISIMSQYVSEPTLVFKISGSCFVPSPKVDVGVVRFVPRTDPLINAPFEVVEKLCRHVFHYRQKYITKGLKTLYPEEMAHDLTHELLSSTRIDPTTTSIRLGMEQFADLAVEYEKQCRRYPGLFLFDYTKPKKTIEMLSELPNNVPNVISRDNIIHSDGVPLKSLF